MGKIGSMMDISRRSLMNSQTALQTTAHNISNKSTDGFSRQRVETETNVPSGQGETRIGMGARASKVSRTNNPFLENQIATESQKFGRARGESENLGRVEQVFNEQINKGLNRFVTDFFNSFRELSNNPESQAARHLVKESGRAVVNDFKRIDSELRKIQDEINFNITAEVRELNQITKEIAQLNERISQVEVSGVSANDEQDRRQLLIKKLSAKINCKAIEGDHGMITVMAGNNALLVSGYKSHELITSPSGGGSKKEGMVSIFYESPPGIEPPDVTHQLHGGSIGGALKIRDEYINEILEDMDQLAFSLATNVNEIHSQGVTSRGRPAGHFFLNPLQVSGAAKSMDLTQTILKDPENISTGLTVGGLGDNRIANAIADLQKEKVMSDGHTTMEDFYNGLVGRVGVEVHRANNFHDHQKAVVGQLENLRESISGVSLDEEAMKMLEYQKQFEASAKLIKVSDELLQTVINLVDR